ncbi:arsenate reductase family protein [Trinickia mobilis]|uniref:arsenate reductase family protein n=1 Tax=Trinickia mobilis TaxID=2816356 RepID=UPI001A90BC4F|nr:arsenate reductase family protein [Trinickia mobilis]
MTIYHNPCCSKSRGACDLAANTFNVSGDSVDIVEYLQQPPTVVQFKELHRMLGGSVRDMLRDNEAPYKELGLVNQTLTDDQLYEAIAAHPILLQRPIVVRNGKAAIGPSGGQPEEGAF